MLSDGQPVLAPLGPPLPGGPASDHTADWSRTRRAIARFRWLVAAIVAASLGAGAVATRVLPPTYSAETMVWIDQDARRGDDPVAAARPSRSFDAAAWVDLVRSYQVLDTVVHALRLNVEFAPDAPPALVAGLAAGADVTPGDYELRIGDGGRHWTIEGADGAVLDAGAMGAPIGARLGFQWVIAPGAGVTDGTTRFSVYTPRDAARRLGEALQVHINPEANFMRIGLEGPDPQRIPAVLNAIAARYVAVAADLQRVKLDEITRILATRTADAERELRSAERAFETFRVSAITHPVDPSSNPTATGGAAGALPSPAVTSYEALQREGEGLSRARAVLQRVVASRGSDQSIAQLSDLDAATRDPDLSAALKDLAAKRAELRSLTYRYSDAYPSVQRLMDEIASLKQATIPELAGRLATTLATREAEVTRDVSRATTTLRAMPPRAVAESRLRRNVDLAAGLYTSLQQRFDAARIAAESRVADVRVLDAAQVPDRPDRSNTIRIMLIALCGGFGVALTTAVGLDRLDSKVRYAQQVSGEMGLVVLGALPHFSAQRRWLTAPTTDDAAMVEAIRSIRMNVAYAHGAAGPLLVTISSPGSADGKSFLAANLARAFAETGRRTILLDGDLRRGILHRKFALDRRPGLSDFLLGDHAADTLIRPTGIARLDLIASGTRTRAAPDLLDHAAMTQLISLVRTRYDVVICDSPPLGAGIDAFVLGAATGAMLLVLRPGVSHREIASAKLDAMARLPIRLLGAVLNDVRDDAGFGYYAYYLPGYEATDETDARRTAPRVLA